MQRYRSLSLMLEAIGWFGILLILVLLIVAAVGYLVVRAIRADLSARTSRHEETPW